MTLARDKIPAIFQDPPWLGFKHDGYPLAPLNQYRGVRRVEFPHAFNREHAAILQSVLSFGLLEAVVDFPVPEDALLRTRKDGRRVLCLDRLPELLAPWASKARAEGKSLTSERKRVETSLSAANTVLSGLSERLDFRSSFRYDKAEADDLPAVFCTLGCLGAALTHARGCLYPDESSYPESGFTWDFVVASLHDRLLGDVCAVGWCPSTVNYIFSLGELASARFFFRRPPVQKVEDHSRCTIAGCALSKVDVDNYVAQHLVKGCNCGHTKPPLDLVIQHIKSGTNPVMMPKVERSGSRIEVADGSRTPYVAISHVWADGLGGNTETGLPTCQVITLSALAANFLSRCAFWQDALCVPKDPSVRQKALKLMGRAYRDAKVILVLDKTVQSVSSKSPVEDVLSCILTSPWMRRMWTLQEANQSTSSSQTACSLYRRLIRYSTSSTLTLGFLA